MPSINQFVPKEPSKKFKKVAYRPWTVLSEPDETPEESSSPPSPTSPHLLNEDVTQTEINKNDHHHIDISTNSKNIKSQNSIDKTTPKEVQKGYKRGTKGVQKGYKRGTKEVQKGYETGTKEVHETGTKGVQKGYETGTKNQDILSPKKEDLSPLSYQHLIGFQKTVFLYIANHCLSSDLLESPPLFMTQFVDFFNMKADIIKTAIKRLVAKGFIIKKASKSGNGGFSIFSIPMYLKNDFLEEGLYPFERGTKGVHFSSSSYNNINNIYIKKTTTKKSLYPFGTHLEESDCTNDDALISLDDGWKEIDILPLAEFGFSKKHLLQLQGGQLTPEMVDDSIKAFAFDLKKNGLLDKIKTHPLNYLMGILKGNQPYAAPSNFEDPKILAMREYLDRKKQHRDELKRMEEELFEMDFEDWKIKITKDDVEKIIPEKRYQEDPLRDGFLKTYFRKNIWKKNLKSEFVG